MKKLISSVFFIILISIILLSASCSENKQTNNVEQANTAVETNTNKSTDTKKDFQVDFKTEPSEVKAGVPTTIFFTIKDNQGVVLKDLQIVHEKLVHLLIVSSDLAEFYHVHPEQQSDGSFKVQHTFPNGGDYRLYADFTPNASSQVIEQFSVKVKGQEKPAVALIPDQKLEKTVDDLRVLMKPEGEIKAGNELMLNFQVFDSKSGKPVTDLQNYLGALAHFVIISQDMKDFVHAHPMSKGDSMEGMQMDESKPHSHDKTTGDAIKTSASEISAHTAFPRAGLYKLWAQFQRNGKVITVPFIVNVPENDKKMASNASIPADAFKVTVNKKGYEPSEIKVEKGKPVKLAFYREDAENCGGELSFPKLNITKKLPVGETVLVEFTPTEAGDISFACGMGMMNGKVIVQ